MYHQTAGGRLGAGVNLPSGAHIESFDLYYDDSDAAANLHATLYYSEGTTTGDTSSLGDLYSTGSAGKGLSTILLNHTVNNDHRQYTVFVFNTAANKKVRAVTIRYELQASPAPGTPTFADVPNTHPFYQNIEALAASGITAGCTAPPNPNYCPDATLTRGQMAVFLARALGDCTGPPELIASNQ